MFDWAAEAAKAAEVAVAAPATNCLRFIRQNENIKTRGAVGRSHRKVFRLFRVTDGGRHRTLLWQDNMSGKIAKRLDLVQGTLDVMVLQTLSTMGPLHGYGLARRIEQTSGNQVLLNQGTIYASLVRLQLRGWIASEWGVSDNNRKAKYYAITKHGSRQLAAETAEWSRLVDVMARVLSPARQEGGQ